MNRGAWRVNVLRVTKSQATTEGLNTYTHSKIKARGPSLLLRIIFWNRSFLF